MYEASITPPLDTGEEAVLLRRAQAGDAAATTRLVKAYLRMVLSQAHSSMEASRESLASSGMTLSDLVSEGNIGLLKAINMYDAEQGTKFATYALSSIRRAIASAIEVQPSRKSMDAPLHEGTRSTLLDVLTGSEGDPQTAGMEEEELREEVQTAIENLSPREQRVIKAFYGIGQSPMTYADIGMSMQLTRERIRQIKTTALRNLRRLGALNLLQRLENGSRQKASADSRQTTKARQQTGKS